MFALLMESVLNPMGRLNVFATQAGLEMVFFVRTWMSAKMKVTTATFMQNALIYQGNICAYARLGGQVMALIALISMNVELTGTRVVRTKIAQTLKETIPVLARMDGEKTSILHHLLAWKDVS